MSVLSSDERALVDELLSCVGVAMRNLDEVDQEYATKTKLQKLIYLASEEFDLPLTYSWYLAGAIVPDDPATPSTLETAFDDLPETDSPTASKQVEEESVLRDDVSPDVAGVDDAETTGDTRDDLDQSDAAAESDAPEPDPVLFSAMTPSIENHDTPDSTNILGDRRDEIVDFYEKLLPEVWHQNTMRFLQNFYLEYAPREYRDLYVQSTHLRTRLREAETTVAAHLNDEDPNQSLGEVAEAAGLDISDLHYSVRSSESLAPTFDGFVRGTDLIEDCLMMLAKQDADSFTEDHLELVRSMQEFFYYYVWRYPCLVISQETATGPSGDLLRRRRQERLTDFEAELDREIEQFENEMAQVGIKPDYSDYETEDDETGELITSLAEQYLEK